MIRATEEQLRRLGQSLREIDPATLQHDPEEGMIRWFQGEAATELTLWLDDDGRTRHAELVFARVQVEWSEAGLSTGTFTHQSSTAGGRYDTYLLEVSGSLDRQVAESALVLLDASDVDAAVREPLCQALRAALEPVIVR
jgi:hypothetical protein